MSINRFEEGLSETPSVRPAPRLQPKLKDFIKGPLCTQWVVTAGSISKDALRVGLALWHEAGFEKDEFLSRGKRQSQQIRVHRKLKERHRLKRSNVSRGIAALQKAGLIVVIENSPGRMQTVAIVNISLDYDDQSSVPF